MKSFLLKKNMNDAILRFCIMTIVIRSLQKLKKSGGGMCCRTTKSQSYKRDQKNHWCYSCIISLRIQSPSENADGNGTCINILLRGGLDTPSSSSDKVIGFLGCIICIYL